MSDECLITLETVVSFYIVYQVVMRKFTLAGKALHIQDTPDITSSLSFLLSETIKECSHSRI